MLDSECDTTWSCPVEFSLVKTRVTAVLTDRCKIKEHVLEECFVLVLSLMPRFDSLWIGFAATDGTGFICSRHALSRVVNERVDAVPNVRPKSVSQASKTRPRSMNRISSSLKVALRESHQIILSSIFTLSQTQSRFSLYVQGPSLRLVYEHTTSGNPLPSHRPLVC